MRLDPSSVRILLDEETVKEPEEERDDNEEHQRREVAEDQNEHEPSFDATGGIEPPSALRRAESISVIAKNNERAAPEVAGAFEIARDRSERRQANRRGLARKRGEQRRSQRIRVSGSADRAIEQPASDVSLSDGDERGLDRAPARDKRFSPLHQRDERLCRFRSPTRCGTVGTERREDEADVASGDHDERTDRSKQAGGGRECRGDKGRDDLRTHQVAIAPAQSALGEVWRGKH